MKKIFAVILTIILILIAVGVWFFWPNNQHNDLIKVENLKANQAIQSPFIITGQARGSWFFEASFPVELLDLSGNVIVQTFAQAKSDWMTTEYVPFEAILNFEINSDTQEAVLVLKKDNPSGLAQNDAEVKIPVVLQKANVPQKDITLYFNNAKAGQNQVDVCSEQALISVSRKIPVSQTPIQDAIRLLLLGPTEQEKSQGITSEYPLDGFSLEGASLNNEILTLAFKDLNNQTIGGSCRVGILWLQIKKTAMQFPEVKEVRFIPDLLFQP